MSFGLAPLVEDLAFIFREFGPALSGLFRVLSRRKQRRASIAVTCSKGVLGVLVTECCDSVVMPLAKVRRSLFELHTLGAI